MAGIVYVLALACLVLLAVGYLVVGALALWPRTQPAAKEVFPVLLTETLIVGVVVGGFLLGGWVLVILLLAHAARTAYEAAAITLPRAGLTGPAPSLAVAAGLVGLSAGAAMLNPVTLSLLALVLFGGALAAWRSGAVTGPASLALELAVFPGLPLIVFTGIALQGGGATLLVAFLLVETFDSYALLGGKLFGRRKAFPVLSPRKTVEGLIVGAIMLALTAAAVGGLLMDQRVIAAVGVALFAGLFTLAGDLAASRLKRAAGVKDFPKVLAHQGGLLDITDAWIATGAGLMMLTVLL